MPTSLPWRNPWVGSCDSQNVLSRRSYETTDGSKTIADRLRMAGVPGAGLAVGRVRRLAALVAHRRDPDARDRPELLLGAPEAAHARRRRSRSRRGTGGQRAAVDDVGAGCHERLGTAGKDLAGARHGRLVGTGTAWDDLLGVRPVYVRRRIRPGEAASGLTGPGAAPQRSAGAHADHDHRPEQAPVDVDVLVDEEPDAQPHQHGAENDPGVPGDPLGRPARWGSGPGGRGRVPAGGRGRPGTGAGPGPVPEPAARGGPPPGARLPPGPRRAGEPGAGSRGRGIQPGGGSGTTIIITK